MDSIEKLTEHFKEFPGIGERQAKRFVYFLMAKNPNYSENLAKLILDLKKEISQCKECFRFFNIGMRKENTCDICSDSRFDESMLMIVEKDSDLESVKKSRFYNGKYFVLGGLVPIVEKSTPSRIRLNELKDKIKNKKNLKEIILAFSLSPQGDHTDMYLKGQLTELAESLKIKVSSLGRGLSTGTELEYSDNETIKNALKNRQ
ncbi:MAG: toprim domain-containing protein [Candidatus Nomurabacteria bacterium]|nr:toprim domain-containing protein [Candidatus Nomurabacteria bacterium]